MIRDGKIVQDSGAESKVLDEEELEKRITAMQQRFDATLSRQRESLTRASKTMQVLAREIQAAEKAAGAAAESMRSLDSIIRQAQEQVAAEEDGV